MGLLYECGVQSESELWGIFFFFWGAFKAEGMKCYLEPQTDEMDSINGPV